MLEIRVAKNGTDLNEVMNIRRSIFVDEQGVYTTSDEDKFDSWAIHLAAAVDGNIVGTVRIYPEGDNIWWGGRLAVLPSFRGKDIGPSLVKAAVELMREKNVKRFLAYIQPQNVPFFERLGWRKLEDVFCCGLPHALMKAPLR
jgi:putative N-acetyltransferase (TIGR04045 family)